MAVVKGTPLGDSRSIPDNAGKGGGRPERVGHVRRALVILVICCNAVCVYEEIYALHFVYTSFWLCDSVTC